MTNGRSRPPVFALVLIGILGLGLVPLIGDAVFSAFRNVDTAVSVANQPQTQAASYTEFDGHPLHEELRMPDATCTLPAFDRTEAALTPYYAALTACLDQAWQPVLAEAGVETASPAVVTDNDPVSACEWLEDAAFTAFYCSADATMYLPTDRMTEWDGGREYGQYAHHVQAVSGLLDLTYEKMGDLPEGSPAGDEILRRFELQANCFAGVFIGSAADRGSIPRPVASGAIETFVYFTLVSTHGSQRNQAEWAARGYRERSLSACDTWSAPASEVAG